MKTAYKHDPPIPYSLHDMVINKIIIDEERIILEFEHGYVSLAAPFDQVEGKIVINDAAYDFCYVVLLSQNGAYGKFQGEKLSLREFVEKYDEYGFEIANETYGYDQVLYWGYLSIAGEKNLIEMAVAINFSGSIVYETEE